MKLPTFKWMVIHRSLGLVTCLGVLMWGLSGIAHPIMTRLQPVPVKFDASKALLWLSDAQSPKTVLNKNGIDQFSRLNVVNFAGLSYFRVVINPSEPARYFAAKTGAELINGDRLYAESLATYYTGLSSSVISKCSFITQFSDDYHAVNQLLPVWRIEFAGDSHLRAFIDTDQARLSTLVDDTRYTFTKIFRFGHNWSALDSVPRVQIVVMALVLAAALVSALSGLYMFVKLRHASKTRLQKKPLQKWHRSLALGVALSTLLFVSSGFLHLIKNYQHAHAEIADIPQQLISTATLSDVVWLKISATPHVQLNLTQNQSGVYWLSLEAAHTQVAALIQQKAQHAEHHHSASINNANHPPMSLIAASDKTAPVDVVDFIKLQATRYAQLPLTDITSTKWITNFEGEYGFLFKRLPVIKVQFNTAEHVRYYIEPATGVLAAKVEDGDATEGFIFAYIHKWVFLDSQKTLRDILVSLFALGNIIVAMMGLVLFYRKRI